MLAWRWPPDFENPHDVAAHVDLPAAPATAQSLSHALAFPVTVAPVRATDGIV